MYLAWCRSVHVDHDRPTYQVLCGFLEYMALQEYSPKTIKNKLSHIKNHVMMIGEPVDVFSHVRVRRHLDALDRDKTYVSKAKLPVPMAVLRAALENIPNKDDGQVVRAAVMLAFYGGLRQSELAPPSRNRFSVFHHPTRGDMDISKHKLHLRVKWGKNYQLYNQSHNVSLEASDQKSTCPVYACYKMFKTTPTAHPDEPLFMFPDTRVPMPHSYIRKRWEQALIQAGVKHKKYSLHSLRKANATEAFRQGVPEISIQRAGGWRSRKSLQSYIYTEDSSAVNAALHKAISRRQQIPNQI